MTNLDNLQEMDRFLKTYKLPRLIHEEIENLNGPEMSQEIQLVIQNLPTNKNAEPDGFTGEIHQTFKEELTPIPYKFF